MCFSPDVPLEILRGGDVCNCLHMCYMIAVYLVRHVAASLSGAVA